MAVPRMRPKLLPGDLCKIRQPYAVLWNESITKQICHAVDLGDTVIVVSKNTYGYIPALINNRIVWIEQGWLTRV